MSSPKTLSRWMVGASICWIAINSSLMLAQDAVSRLKEYAAESAVFRSPHVLHFDIVVITDNPVWGRFDSIRLIGRHVHINKSKFRNDFVKYSVSTTNSYREEKLFLHLSSDEKYSSYRDSDTEAFGGIQRIDWNSDSQADIVHCNPFAFLIQGETELHRQSYERNTMDRLIEVVRDLEQSEQFVVLSKKKTAMQFTFANDDSWRIMTTKVLAPSKDPESIMKHSKIDSLEDLKDYEHIFESSAKWREIDDKHKIPFYVTARNQQSSNRTIDFKGFFFGISLDVSPYENLFDLERLNDEDWRADHNPDEIEALSMLERKMYLK